MKDQISVSWIIRLVSAFAVGFIVFKFLDRTFREKVLRKIGQVIDEVVRRNQVFFHEGPEASTRRETWIKDMTKIINAIAGTDQDKSDSEKTASTEKEEAA